MKRKNRHRGRSLSDLLKEDGVLKEVEARAWKRALAMQLRQLLAEQEDTKADMAARMGTNRAVVDRLLNSSNASATFATLGKAPRGLGRRVRIELVPG
jgi:antitoxin HicB